MHTHTCIHTHAHTHTLTLTYVNCSSATECDALSARSFQGGQQGHHQGARQGSLDLYKGVLQRKEVGVLCKYSKAVRARGNNSVKDADHVTGFQVYYEAILGGHLTSLLRLPQPCVSTSLTWAGSTRMLWLAKQCWIEQALVEKLACMMLPKAQVTPWRHSPDSLCTQGMQAG